MLLEMRGVENGRIAYGFKVDQELGIFFWDIYFWRNQIYVISL